jgi:hypothetical protein
MSMAESSGEEENPYPFHSYSRKSEQKYGEEHGDTEDNSLKPDLGLGNTQTVEKKAIIENYGSGKHCVDFVDRVDNLFCLRVGISIMYKSVK